MNNPLLSICVSIHNTGLLLERCIKSLVNQTYSNIEIILVNNGSTDNSIDIMKLYSEQYPKIIKFFSQEDKGLSQGRQRGVDESTGVYIGFVDSDDYIEPNMYAEMMENALCNNADIVECKAIKDNVILGQGKIGIFDSKIELSNFLRYGSPMPMLWSRIYKRELFNGKYLPLPSFYVNNEDIFALPCLLAKSRNIFYLNRVFYHYTTDNENGVMKMVTSKKKRSERIIDNRIKTLYAVDHFEQYLKINELEYSPKTDVLIYKKNTILGFLTKKIVGFPMKAKIQTVINIFGFKTKKKLYRFIKNNLCDSKTDKLIKIIGVHLFLIIYRR